MTEPVVEQAPADAVSFIFFGDAGNGDAAQYAVGRAVGAWCATHRCDFVALLGDNFYPVGVRSRNDPQWQTKFELPYATVNLPFHPALGNHDYLGHASAELRYRSDRWAMPARYYQFRAGPADFFVVDTERYTRREHAWLEGALAASDAPVKVVYGHHPVLSSGEHGATGGRVAEMAALLHRAGVTVYLCGHDHNLEVLEQPPGPDAPGTLPLVVSGGGGASTRAITPGPDSRFAARTRGFGYMEIHDGAAVVTLVDSEGRVLYTQSWPTAR